MKEQELEFHFVDENGDEVDLKCADWMVAFFDCLWCGTGLKFQKPYEPVPLHYESLLRKCKPVICPKCGTLHKHHDEDGIDVVVAGELKDSNQLFLFQ